MVKETAKSRSVALFAYFSAFVLSSCMYILTACRSLVFHNFPETSTFLEWLFVFTIVNWVGVRPLVYMYNQKDFVDTDS